MATQRTRRDQSQWQKLVNQQASSGLSAAAFCRQMEISYASFMAWRKRLLASESEIIPQPTPSQFIELTSAYRASDDGLQDLPRSGAPGSSIFCVELSLGDGIELRISRG